MQFKSYPDKKTTPNRRARKTERNRIFQYNYKLHSRLNREKRSLNNA